MKTEDMCRLLANYTKELEQAEGIGDKGIVQIKHANIIFEQLEIENLRDYLQEWRRVITSNCYVKPNTDKKQWLLDLMEKTNQILSCGACNAELELSGECGICIGLYDD